jgi:1-acyl-sn-glycerol-3-phosphate acyltransferase
LYYVIQSSTNNNYSFSKDSQTVFLGSEQLLTNISEDMSIICNSYLFLRAGLFYIFAILWTAILSLITFFAFYFKGEVKALIMARRWAQGLTKLSEVICGIKVRIEGPPPLPTREKGMIIASKHQSAWETIFFMGYFPNANFILKKELGRLPLLGWYFRTISIAIDRSAKVSSIKQMLHKVEENINQGRIIIIFPEGTRVKVGQEGKIQSGIAAIYLYNDKISIIPAALNSGLLWGPSQFIKKPGTVTVRFSPAIPAGLSKEEFITTLEKGINSIIV